PTVQAVPRTRLSLSPTGLVASTLHPCAGARSSTSAEAGPAAAPTSAAMPMPQQATVLVAIRRIPNVLPLAVETDWLSADHLNSGHSQGTPHPLTRLVDTGEGASALSGEVAVRPAAGSGGSPP